MHRVRPTFHRLAEMPTAFQQVKDHPRPFRAPTRRYRLPFHPKCAALKSTVKSLRLCSQHNTPSSIVYVSHGYSPFSAFWLYFVSLSRGCHKLSWYNEINRQPNFFPAANVHAKEWTSVTALLENLLLGSLQQSFTFRGVFVAQSEVLAVLESISC